MKLLVNKLTSTKTQMPYDYYSLPFCKPSHVNAKSDNIGQAISGDRIEKSIYNVSTVVSVMVLTTIIHSYCLRCPVVGGKSP